MLLPPPPIIAESKQAPSPPTPAPEPPSGNGCRPRLLYFGIVALLAGLNLILASYFPDVAFVFSWPAVIIAGVFFSAVIRSISHAFGRYGEYAILFVAMFSFYLLPVGLFFCEPPFRRRRGLLILGLVLFLLGAAFFLFVRHEK